jgi:hypothetical protein
MKDDIVARLREWSVEAQLPETRESTVRMRAVNALAIAADEIERLRAELVSNADELAATFWELRKVHAERNEARGNAILAEHLLWDARCDICYEIAAAKTNLPQGHPDTVVEAKAEADRRGWNCFKEGGNAC